MIVTCLGHAKFLLELDNGLRIVTDPYDDQSGYPVTPVNADVVLVSHGHRRSSNKGTCPLRRKGAGGIPRPFKGGIGGGAESHLPPGQRERTDS